VKIDCAGSSITMGIGQAIARRTATVDGQTFTDIFGTRMHMFADTPLRMMRAVWWTAWIDGPGQYLHAEYMLAQMSWPPDLARQIAFQWDRVTLPYKGDHVDVSYANMLIDWELVSADCRFRYKALSRKNMYKPHAYYCLIKADTVRNIEISLMFNAPKNLSDTRAFDWSDATYALYVKQGCEVEKFSIITKDDCVQVCVLTTTAPPSAVTVSHNIFEIIAFMKTSRLDLGAHLPRIGEAKN
jgi:hypothetical protein